MSDKKWSYAWLSHLAKIFGGPKKLIAVIAALGILIGNFFAFIGGKIKYLFKRKRKIKEEQTIIHCKDCIYYDKNECWCKQFSQKIKDKELYCCSFGEEK